MRRRRTSVGSLLAAVLVVVCLPASSPAHVSGTSVPWCKARMLRLSLGPDVSPMTGEHAYLFELTDRSAGSCVLQGYPGIRLIHHASTLAFVYRQGGGYVTQHKPKRVTLNPRSRAYFLVAKYRCDVGDLRTTTAIRVALPSIGGHLTLRLNQAYTGFDYCKPQPGNPGNHVDVSPVEATASATNPVQ